MALGVFQHVRCQVVRFGRRNMTRAQASDPSYEVPFDMTYTI